MPGAWRYTTDWTRCVRVWRYYSRVGPAEIVRGIIPACVRGGAVVLPILVGPSALPAAPARPALPWIGAPGWVTAASLPFGPGGYEYGLPVGSPGLGWGTFLGLSAGSLNHPASITVAPQRSSAAAFANPVPQQTTGARPELPSDTPTDVPEPPALALLLAGLVLACLQPRTKRL